MGKDIKKKKNTKNSNSTRSSKMKNYFLKIKTNIFPEVEEENCSNMFSLFEVFVIVIIAIIFGVTIGYMVTNPMIGNRSNAKVAEIINTYNTILDNYYDEVDGDSLADAAIKGMIDSLDDTYSNFMDTTTTENFNETVDGSFVGIGVEIMFDGEYNTIVGVMENSPAEKVGLQVDDVIVKVDDIDTNGMYGDELSKLVRGEIGTKVKITVKRKEEEKEFTIKRGTIEIESVSNRVIEYDGKNIGYIKIDSFASNTYTQFQKALDQLEKEKIDSLILDVRNNSGGHLQQTKEILSLFFSKKTVLYQVQTKNSTEKVYSLSNATRKYPIAVLINESSASASEILASCFQDNYKKAVIVGETSYGKGTVQKSVSLSTGSSIKYTTQKWLTSKGKWLDGKGVEPNIKISQSQEYYESPSDDTDSQLQEAFKQLKSLS